MSSSSFANCVSGAASQIQTEPALASAFTVPVDSAVSANVSALANQAQVNELDPFILVKSATGGWIKVAVANPLHKKELVELYDSLRGANGQDFTFNLTEVYAENKGCKDHNFSTDTPAIKKIRSLVAKILHYDDLPWKEFPAHFRSGANLPSAMTRKTPPLEKGDSKRHEFTELKAEKAKELIKNSIEKLETLSNNSAIPAERKAAITKAKHKLEKKMHHRAIHFALTQDNTDVNKRIENAQNQLNIDPKKDREYLEDVVRLSCKDRSAYVQDTATIQALYDQDKETPGLAIGHRADGLESFFVQFVNADTEARAKLVNGPLFAACFADTELHQEDLKALGEALLVKYTSSVAVQSSVAPQLPAAASSDTAPIAAIPAVSDSSSGSSSAAAAAAQGASVRAQDKPGLWQRAVNYVGSWLPS